MSDCGSQCSSQAEPEPLFECPFCAGGSQLQIGLSGRFDDFTRCHMCVHHLQHVTKRCVLSTCIFVCATYLELQAHAIDAHADQPQLIRLIFEEQKKASSTGSAYLECVKEVMLYSTLQTDQSARNNLLTRLKG